MRSFMIAPLSARGTLLGVAAFVSAGRRYTEADLALAEEVDAALARNHAAIEAVLDDPRRYGFRNVTTADPARAATTALYADEFHLGRHGQAVIARTVAAALGGGAAVRAALDGMEEDGSGWAADPRVAPAGLPVVSATWSSWSSPVPPELPPGVSWRPDPAFADGQRPRRDVPHRHGKPPPSMA
jgi:hypothetical protein